MNIGAKYHRTCTYAFCLCVITGHSMAETLTVALRVAEEAIEEAIAKAEEFGDSLVRPPPDPPVPLVLPIPLFISVLLLVFPPLFTSPL